MNLVKNAFISLAMESIETSSTNAIVENRAVTPAAQILIDQHKHRLIEEAKVTREGPTIAMNGPLSTIFARALNIAYAKVDPATGEVNSLMETPATNNGTPAVAAGSNEAVVAMETQSNDWVEAAMALKEKRGSYPQDGNASGNPNTSQDAKKAGSDTSVIATSTSGVRAVTLEPDEIIPIFQRPDPDANLTPMYSDVIFYTDATRPTDSSPMGENRNSFGMINMGDNWQTTIESISIMVKLKEMPSTEEEQKYTEEKLAESKRAA